jgi:hypothetical protein
MWIVTMLQVIKIILVTLIKGSVHLMRFFVCSLFPK